MTFSSDQKEAVAKVLIVEDRVQTAERFRKSIHQTPGLSVCSVAFDVDTALHKLATFRPRIVLVDLGLPDGSGLEVIAAAQQAQWECESIVITVFGDERRVFEALRAGAKGYILKVERAQNIGDSIHDLLQGGSPMSPKIARFLLREAMHSNQGKPIFEGPSALSKRESDVMELIAQGMKRQDVAEKLNISIGTVGTHVHKIYTKLGVKSNIAAIRQASKLGLI